MGSYATVFLSDGRPVVSFRGGVDPLFFILFTKDQQVSLNGAEAFALLNNQYVDLDEDEAEVIGFRATAGVLIDRLDLLGVDHQAIASRFAELVSERLELSSHIDELNLTHGIEIDEELRTHRDEERRILESLTWEDWVADMTTGLASSVSISRLVGPDHLSSPSWLMGFWEEQDPRLHLRALLEAVPQTEVITLDLAELGEDWREEFADPQEHAKKYVAYTSGGGLTPIVLTEGVFDVEVLAASLRIRRPHLVDFIRLPDFSPKPEGSASALRQTIRAFASAGIPNRVVALFDNDAAARETLMPLQQTPLPPNLAVTLLPPLPLAARYPTIGPQGHVEMDVNGLAASIEMYLGEDVLRPNGDLVPVEWSGLMKKLGEYQGALADKAGVQDRWRAKVRAAEADPSVIESQDWSGIDLLLEHLTTVIRDIRVDF